MNHNTNATLLGRLLKEGRISPALANAAMERNTNLGERSEEALLECGLPESALLRHLAEMFGTKFISTKTLRSIVAPPQVLSRLPQRLAEDYQTVPIRYGADETVTVITADAGNKDLLERIRVAAGARRVAALIARPAAVRAAIAKLYGGETNAFDSLGTSDDIPPSSEQTTAATAALSPAIRGAAQLSSGSPTVPPTGSLTGSTTVPPAVLPTVPPALPHSGPPTEPTAQAGAPEQPPTPPGRSAVDLSSREDSLPSAIHTEPSPTQLGADEPAPRSMRSNRPTLPPPPPSLAPAQATATPPAPASLGQGISPTSLTDPTAPPAVASLTEQSRATALGNPTGLTEALIVISERSRGPLKGHSVRVARLAYALCRELDLSEAQAAFAWAAGLLHDLGKTQPHHLTALNVWQLRDHESAGRSQYGNPSRMLKSADVHPTVSAAILHMYERFDGRGFPEGLKGERIPYLSRVLALCDTVMDLTLNPSNTLGRMTSPIEACNHIKAQTPRVFDPTLVAHFARLLVESRLEEVFVNERSVQGIEKLLA